MVMRAVLRVLSELYRAYEREKECQSTLSARAEGKKKGKSCRAKIGRRR